MRKIRINNEFTHHWAIVLDGAPVDLTALQKRLYLIHPLRTKEIEQFDTNGNIISVELTKKLLNIVGVYSLELHYELPDPTRENGIRYCAVDVRLCQIVPTTEQADEVAEFTTTTDMAFGFQGKSAYEVWLKDNPDKTKEDYFNWLQKPATDIAETVNLQEQARVDAENIRKNNEEQRVDAEAVRVSAETSRASNEDQRTTKETAREAVEASRVSAETSRATAEAVRVQAEDERETAELTRQSSESERNENEGLRVNAEGLRATAESSRETAESLRVDAEILRQTNTQIAITNTEEATLKANTAAQNADDARDNIMPSVLNNEEVQAETYNDLNERIIALENLVKEAIYSKITTDTIDVMSEIKIKGSPLIYVKDGAPSFAPDQVPQFYIDITGRKLYTARGTSSASDWF